MSEIADCWRERGKKRCCTCETRAALSGRTGPAAAVRGLSCRPPAGTGLAGADGGDAGAVEGSGDASDKGAPESGRSASAAESFSRRFLALTAAADAPVPLPIGRVGSLTGRLSRPHPRHAPARPSCHLLHRHPYTWTVGWTDAQGSPMQQSPPNGFTHTDHASPQYPDPFPISLDFAIPHARPRPPLRSRSLAQQAHRQQNRCPPQADLNNASIAADPSYD